jgi:hypothetical protein
MSVLRFLVPERALRCIDIDMVERLNISRGSQEKDWPLRKKKSLNGLVVEGCLDKHEPREHFST